MGEPVLDFLKSGSPPLGPGVYLVFQQALPGRFPECGRPELAPSPDSWAPEVGQLQVLPTSRGHHLPTCQLLALSSPRLWPLPGTQQTLPRTPDAFPFAWTLSSGLGPYYLNHYIRLPQWQSGVHCSLLGLDRKVKSPGAISWFPSPVHLSKGPALAISPSPVSQGRPHRARVPEAPAWKLPPDFGHFQVGLSTRQASLQRVRQAASVLSSCSFDQCC